MSVFGNGLAWRRALALMGLALGLGAQMPAAAAPEGVVRLSTPWTEAALKAPLPLPEYPRPQLVRKDWLNLNGTWDYWGGRQAPDAANAPASAPAFPAQPESIRVPYPVESRLSGIERLNERNLWYRRGFEVPAGWTGRQVRLNFGAVDRLATVYVNGTRVGQHEGGFTAFSFDITPHLKSGRNEVVVGVFDPNTGDGLVGKQSLKPEGIFYTTNSGIWQTVWLEPVAASHVAQLETRPDLAGQQLKLRVRADQAEGVEVHAQALREGKVVGEVRGPVGRTLDLPLPNARLWSPTDPYLYDLKLSLRRGAQVLDEVSSYFGMRSIAVGYVDGIPRPLLNGQFVFQFGPLDQGYWPDGIYTAPTDEALRFDLEVAKKLGFNMVRKHIKVEPARWFYWADKLGLLVWQDMPQAWDAETKPHVRERVQAEMREIIEQHRSSTSVVSWIVFNESWGDFDHRRMANLVRSWDPYRLVNAHSGINFAPHDEGGGEVVDLHDYPGPAAPAWTPGRIGVLGEYGGNSLRIDGHMYKPSSKCCYLLYESREALTEAYLGQVGMLRELLHNRGLSAAVYTETTDVEEELNGFYTYDRKVQKMDFAKVAAANRALVDAVPRLRDGVSVALRARSGLEPGAYLAHGATAPRLHEALGTANEAALLSWRVQVDDSAEACLVLESLQAPGQFLAVQGSHASLGSTGERLCPRRALDGSPGLSLESQRNPGQYLLRAEDGSLRVAAAPAGAAGAVAASWQPQSGAWRSTLRLSTAPAAAWDFRAPQGCTGCSVQAARVEGPVEFKPSSGAAAPMRWRLVPGLAEASCYSFESLDQPGQYLRHADSRVRADRLRDETLFKEDATFCAEGLRGGELRWASYNFPSRYLRRHEGALWIADGNGGEAWNSPKGLTQDSRWLAPKP